MTFLICEVEKPPNTSKVKRDRPHLEKVKGAKLKGQPWKNQIGSRNISWKKKCS